MGSSYIELLLILAIICAAVVFVAVLLYGIIRLIKKIREYGADRRYEEGLIAISVYRSVCQRTDELPAVDAYDNAVQRAFSENDLSGSSFDETAEKIAEVLTKIQITDMAQKAMER